MIAVTGTTGGGILSWSPGVACIIKELMLDVTVEATGAATGDFGVAAATTSNDTLINAVDLGTAPIFASATQNAGTNGVAPVKCSATQYVTGTASATLADMVGTYIIEYVIQ